MTDDPIRAFLTAIADAGLAPHGDLDLVDGRLVRYRVADDRAGKRNGWAVFYSSPTPAGAFGSWKTGASHTWRMRPPADETRAQREQRRRQLEDMRRQRLAEQELMHRHARERAARLWAAARPATDDHAYLQTKRVHAYGIRRLRDMLVIPARDAAGVLHTLQFIGPDGIKRFLSGGRIEGCYCAIGRPSERLYLAEGWASAATVHAATGDACAACFSAGNLKSVAMALRAKFPDLALVIAADNDAGTPGNPGVRHAFDAAAAAGALVAVPDFTNVSPP